MKHISARAGGVCSVALITLIACDIDKTLSVEEIDVSRPSALSGVSALPTLFASTINEFTVSYSGSNVDAGHITMGALLADEFQFAESFPTRQEWDKREQQPQNGTTDGALRQSHRARAFAELAARRYAEFAPADANRSIVMSLAAFQYIFLAEQWCSGIPTSQFTDAGELQYGDPLTTIQLLQIAVAKADSAVTLALGNTRAEFLARVAKGRALLDLGRFDEAATAVAGVPVTYRFDVLHSANTVRQNNGIWNFAHNQRRWTVADRKGGNGLNFQSSADPRVRATRRTGTPGTGFDNSTPLFVPNIYPDRGSAAALATGVEASLIRAEAALRAGDGATLLSLHNALRANTGLYACPPLLAGCSAPAVLQALSDPGTLQGRTDLHFRERAFWLYLTGHRLGDLRRLVRQYGRSQEQVFPTGAYHKGGTYGSDVVFIVPEPDELNNPKFKGCLDRKA